MVLEAEAIRVQVERILQNKNLRLSEVQRRLFSYLADKSLSGEADELKEYTLGLDAFGKPPSYDPRQESVVRMHVARLRQKLADYYRIEGVNDPILVDLPKGGFKVTFLPRSPAPQIPGGVIESLLGRWRLRIGADPQALAASGSGAGGCLVGARCRCTVLRGPAGEGPANRF